MDIQKIKELALANGFKLKEQASGNMDLNAYVYDFANAIEQAAKAQAVPKGYVLVPIKPSEDLIDKLASVICDEFDTTITGSAHCASEAYRAMVGESK